MRIKSGQIKIVSDYSVAFNLSYTSVLNMQSLTPVFLVRANSLEINTKLIIRELTARPFHGIPRAVEAYENTANRRKYII